jgi:hypothetical protein
VSVLGKKPKGHDRALRADVEHAWITATDDLCYRCGRCRKVHWHGADGERLGNVTHRVSHCLLASRDDQGVWLLVVADARKAVA